MSSTETDLDRWLGAGIAVFQGATDPADFPPLDDPDAQRAWLDGFAAAWAECPDGAGGWCDGPLEDALCQALAGREALWRQLQGQGELAQGRAH